MISFDLLAAFCSAARQQSFAGAARDLGLSPSAIAKNIARLENQLDMRLFHRTTRQVTLSPDGENIYDLAQQVLECVEALEATAGSAQKGARGILRIDMPNVYGRRVILPALLRLKTQHPDLGIDARFSDHVVDIVKEGLDLAVRIGHLADSSLIARNIDHQSVAVYASPDYLEEHGAPLSPADLTGHSCLLFRLPSSGRNRPWQFRKGKRSLSWMPESDIELADGEALVQAAMDGFGLIQVPTYIASEQVKRKRLVEVLAKYRPTPTPISLVYPSHRHVPLRVRAVIEALTEEAALPDVEVC